MQSSKVVYELRMVLFGDSSSLISIARALRSGMESLGAEPERNIEPLAKKPEQLIGAVKSEFNARIHFFHPSVQYPRARLCFRPQPNYESASHEIPA